MGLIAFRRSFGLIRAGNGTFCQLATLDSAGCDLCRFSLPSSDRTRHLIGRLLDFRHCGWLRPWLVIPSRGNARVDREHGLLQFEGEWKTFILITARLPVLLGIQIRDGTRTGNNTGRGVELCRLQWDFDRPLSVGVSNHVMDGSNRSHHRGCRGLAHGSAFASVSRFSPVTSPWRFISFSKIAKEKRHGTAQRWKVVELQVSDRVRLLYVAG